ncbi:hypothetical protein BCR43DRAFT_543801 [Syncephalastrum racemosum]|uniref:Extracellular membrane protein CFEM domain-containing protein n=1 Tax=Syncephalastrum racemosum TaxID=13706 RepID=A0A1X2HIC4_SYNRA|nr:hypothetical protein BCR43DRAFT_543801 [Syncephalastrum racemosum]
MRLHFLIVPLGLLSALLPVSWAIPCDSVCLRNLRSCLSECILTDVDDSDACMAACFANSANSANSGNKTDTDEAYNLNDQHNIFLNAVHSASMSRRNVVHVAETTTEGKNVQAESNASSASFASATSVAESSDSSDDCDTETAQHGLAVPHTANPTSAPTDDMNVGYLNADANTHASESVQNIGSTTGAMAWELDEAHSSMNHAENTVESHTGDLRAVPTSVEEDDDCEDDEEPESVASTGNDSDMSAPVANARGTASDAGVTAVGAPTSVMLTNTAPPTVTAHTTITSRVSAQSVMPSAHDFHRADASGNVVQHEGNAAATRPIAAFLGLTAFIFFI